MNVFKLVSLLWKIKGLIGKVEKMDDKNALTSSTIWGLIIAGLGIAFSILAWDYQLDGVINTLALDVSIFVTAAGILVAGGGYRKALGKMIAEFEKHKK